MNLRRFLTVLSIGVPACMFCGCQSPGKPEVPSLYQSATGVAQAKRENEKGLDQLSQGKFAEAEQAFKKALALDVGYGAAHNNLGRVFLEQNRLYEAAWEFQSAAKIMPTRPEPLNNLGLVYEAAAKWKDAVDMYQKALALAPDEPQYVANLARAKCRRGDKDDELARLLRTIIDRDPRASWVSWAQDTLRGLHVSPETQPVK